MKIKKYIIPRMVSPELLVIYIQYIIMNNGKVKHNTDELLDIFIEQNNDLSIAKTKYLKSIINNNKLFLENTDFIIKNEDKTYSINENFSDKIKKYNNEELFSFVKSYYQSFYKPYFKHFHILDENNKNINLENLYKFTENILEIRSNYNKKLSENTIKRDMQYLKKFITDFYLGNKKSLLYTRKKSVANIEIFDEVTNNKEAQLDLIRNTILAKCNIKDKFEVEIIKNQILTDGLIDSIVNQNYNGDVNLFISDISNEDIEEPDYLNIIGNYDVGTKKFLEYLNNNNQIIILTDSDNDGTSALTGAKKTSEFLKKINPNYKIFADYARVIPGSIVNHGINFAHLELMRKNGRFKKDDPLLFITADNGINSREELELIYKNYPNAEVIITDHHSMDTNMGVQENDKTIIINHHYKSNHRKLNGFEICGGHTFNLLLENVLRNIPVESIEKENLIEQLNRINKLANYADMVHAHPASRLKTMTTLKNFSQNSNLMNAIFTLLPLWEKENIDADYFKENYFATNKEAELIKNKFEFIQKEAELINRVYNKILDGKYSNIKEIEEELLSINTNFQKNTKYKSFPTIFYMRPIMMDFITKDVLNEQESVLYDFISKTSNNFLMKIKDFEKELIKPLRRNIDLLSTKIEKEKVKMIILNKTEDSSITRKFYLKLDPQTNDGILTIFDTVKDKELGGSIRMVEHKFAEIKDKAVTKKQFNKWINKLIKDNTLSKKIKKDMNLDVQFLGHEKGAAGIYIKSDKKITKEHLNILAESLNESYINLDKNSDNKLIDKAHIYHRFWLPKILDIFSVMKIGTLSSGNMFQPKFFVQSNTVPFTKGADIQIFDNEMTYEENKNIDEIGYKLSIIDFHSGKRIIGKNSDLVKSNKNRFFELKFMNPDTLMINNNIDIKEIENLKFINYPNNLSKKLNDFYEKNFNFKNDFTVSTPYDEFVSKHPLINKNDDSFKKILIESMKKTNTKEFAVLDTEGTGFGKFAKLFNIGLTRYILNKSGNDIEEVKTTNIIIKLDEPISIAAENLTGITNHDLLKKGIPASEADKILSKIYRGKRVLFSAHNAPYDINITEANLDKFSKIIKNNIIIDTAYLARDLDLAFDNREKVGSFSIENNLLETVESFKYFILDIEDYSSIENFISNPSHKKTITNLNGELMFEWEYNKNVDDYLLIKRETDKDNKKIKIGFKKDLSFNFKEEYKAKKYSVSEILLQTFVNIIREELNETIIPNNNIKKYITHVKPIDEVIFNFIDHNKYNFSLTQKENLLNIKKSIKIKNFITWIDNLDEKEYEILDEEDRLLISEMKTKISKMRKNSTYENRVLKEKTNTISKLIDNKLVEFVKKYEKNAENSNKFNHSTAVKTIIKNYNYLLSKEENIINIKEKNGVLDRDFILKTIEKIEYIDNKIKSDKGLNELLNSYNISNFHELFYENHNNIDLFLSDTSLEGAAVIVNLFSKLNYNVSEVSKRLILNSYSKAEKNKMLRDIESVPAINTFSFSQLVRMKRETSRTKLNWKNFNHGFKESLVIVKINDNYNMLMKLHNDEEKLENLEKIGKRLEELSQIVFDINKLKNTFLKYEAKLNSLLNNEDVKNSDNDKNIITIEFLNNLNQLLKEYTEINKNIETTIKEKYIDNKRKKEETILKEISIAENTSNIMIQILKFSSNIKEIYMKTIEELKTYGDFTSIITTKENLKIFTDMISETIETSLMNENYDINDIRNIFLEKISKKRSLQPIEISKEEIKFIKREITNYLNKLQKFSDGEVSNLFKSLNTVIFIEGLFNAFFTETNNNFIKFDNNLEDIITTTTEDPKKFLNKIYINSMFKLNSINNISIDEEEIIDLKEKNETKIYKNLEHTLEI